VDAENRLDGKPVRWAGSLLVVPLIVLMSCSGGTTTSASVPAKPWKPSGFSRQRWSRPVTEVELKANLKAAGFPKWWPRLDGFDIDTFVMLSRSASTISGKRSATYITEWRSAETDLAVSAALWRKKIPKDIIAEKTVAIEGSEQPGIDPKEERKYIEYVQRDAEGFATATARVTESMSGSPAKVTGTVLRLQWDSPKESPDLLTDSSIWGWVKMLPPIDAPMTDTSLDASQVANQTTALVSYAPSSAADAAAITKRLTDPTSWSRGAKFVDTTEADGEQVVIFRIGNVEGGIEGSVRCPIEGSADYHLTVSAHAKQ
jgi:hypothetical protein